MRDNLAFDNNQETESVEEEIISDSLALHVIKAKLSIGENVRFEHVQCMGSKFSKNGETRIRPNVAKFSEFKIKEKLEKMHSDWLVQTSVLLNNSHLKFKQRARNCGQS